MRYRFARPEGTRARLLNNQEKMSALSAFTPPPPDYYTKGNVLFAFAEAVAAGRRPGSATGSGSVGCLHDRHCTTLLSWCAAGSHRGVSRVIGEICLTIGGIDQVDGFGLS